nr:hypothetical protein [Tanacetum cinerariifolium]
MDNKKHIVNLESFKDILHICPRFHGQSFTEPPFVEEILAFIHFLRPSAAIRMLTDVNIKKLCQPWKSFAAIINKCLTGKSSGYDSLRLSQAQILWGLYHKRNVDYAYLMWETLFIKSNTKVKRRAMRCTIPDSRRLSFTTSSPKPKASVKRTRSSPNTSISPPTVATSLRLIAYAKGKQIAKASKPKSLSALSEVAITEAQHLKLVTKRSMQQAHISQPSGSGADEGTGSKPRVPDVPTDESEEELSWNSTDDKGDDNEEKDDDDQGSKRRGEGKEPESASAPIETATRSAGRSIQPWISELVKQADTRSSFNELMDTPLDFSNFLINRLKVDTLTSELLVGPTYELMKGSCKSLVELEYHLEAVFKATTDQLDWVNPEGVSSRKYTTSITKKKATNYGNIKWIEDLVPRKMWIEEPTGYDKHALWGRRIIAVTELKIVEWHSYKHLDWITVRRDDDKLYKFKDGDFKRLRIQDIEVLMLLVQGKLTNLTVEEHFAFNISLRMFTRSIVIQRRVKDLKLGVESYQKKLNLTKLDSYRSDLKRKKAYTAYYDRLKGIRMQYLPQSIWRKSDTDKAAAMIHAIDKRLKKEDYEELRAVCWRKAVRGRL